jgi:hypothetical protein
MVRALRVRSGPQIRVNFDAFDFPAAVNLASPCETDLRSFRREFGVPWCSEPPYVTPTLEQTLWFAWTVMRRMAAHASRRGESVAGFAQVPETFEEFRKLVASVDALDSGGNVTSTNEDA